MKKKIVIIFSDGTARFMNSIYSGNLSFKQLKRIFVGSYVHAGDLDSKLCVKIVKIKNYEKTEKN